MYKRITEKEPQIDIYVNKLIEEGSFSKADVDEHKQWVWGMLEESFTKSKDYTPTSKEWTTSAWNGFNLLLRARTSTSLLPRLWPLVLSLLRVTTSVSPVRMWSVVPSLSDTLSSTTRRPRIPTLPFST
ncbi:hypothetical protein LB505_004964 [Fusarium chuoi]|nr:hypothetical protein LB505_004964 [Fusarium chuoi]